MTVTIDPSFIQPVYDYSGVIPMKTATHRTKNYQVEILSELHGYVTYKIRRRRTRSEQAAGQPQYKVKTRTKESFDRLYSVNPQFEAPADEVYVVQYVGPDGEKGLCGSYTNYETVCKNVAAWNAAEWDNLTYRVVEYTDPSVVSA